MNSIRTVRIAGTRGSAALIVLFCSILTLAFLGPRRADAAVTVLDAFPATPQINNTTASPATVSFSPTAGSNRIILISVHDHTNNTTATTISVTYGSNNVPATLIVNSPNNQRRQSWLFYLNENDIASATGTTITVNNNNVGSGMSAYLSTLSGVDQTNTIVPTPYSIYSPTVSYSLSVGAGGYAFFASTDNSAADPTNDEGYTGSASTAVGAAYSYIATKEFASAATTAPAYTTDANFSSFAAAALNPAPAGSPGSLQLNSGTYSVNENGGTVTITATRTGGSAGAVSVSYATADGTAASGSDYTAASGTLAWADGDTANKTFSVTITNDGTAEVDETFTASLSGPTGGATLGSPSGGTVTIADDDGVPPPAQVPAGNTLLFAALAGGMAFFALRKNARKKG